MAECADEVGYLPIADYAVIGDCHTAALVARNGSIDWYCPGRFDAPAVFCRLLDERHGGYFSLAPVGESSARRRYQEGTNILQTEFEAAGGRVRLTDFMSLRERSPSARGQDVESSHRLLRLVEGLSGEVELALRIKATPAYGRAPAPLVVIEGGALMELPDGQGEMALSAPSFSLVRSGEEWSGRSVVHAGERCWAVLSARGADANTRRAAAAGDLGGQLGETQRYWLQWSEACTYRGPYRPQVIRSALALKLLTYEPSGAIVAAPTTSLPEIVGGVRNWDYRYAWLRDSALILYALITIGYESEAEDFFRWLCLTQQGNPQAAQQIMYRIDGGRDLPERTLDYLQGYRCSRPVRIGNRASQQVQLDIYGEVLGTAYMHFHAGRGQANGPDGDTWRSLRSLVEDAARHWQEPDEGIWEVRGGPQRFVYSRLMCWAALDRGIRLAEEHGLPAPLGAWKRVRTDIREAILRHGYDDEEQAFTQALEGRALDASALLIPRLGLLPPTDARVRSTVERIRRDLTADGLVYRYRDEDGLPGGEAAFTPCSFWLVSALALSGQVEDAHWLFEHVLGYANDVGLLSEEIDPGSHALLGNFPQGLTHTALIGAAVDLAKASRHGGEEQPENEAQRARRAGPAAAHGYARFPAGDMA